MKRFVFLLIFFICMIIGNSAYAKYTIEKELIVASVKIDPQPPTIELLDIYNNNTAYPQYANRTNKIELTIVVKEKNILENNFNKNYIEVIVGETIIEPEVYEIIKVGESSKMIMYKITLKGILEEGKLQIKAKEGTVKDKADQVNVETILDTNIEIDNTSPVITSFEEEIEDGKVLMNLISNELIRKVNGWEISENQKQLKKEFLSNVGYPFLVTDLAGNNSQVDVSITKATNIKIQYGALNSNTNWSFGYGNNEVAGKETISNNQIYKTEGISLYYEGSVEKDFIGLQTYMYTYWGPGIQGICRYSETRYNYGYNPKENEYGNLENSFLSNVDKKLSVYQGGRRSKFSK